MRFEVQDRALQRAVNSVWQRLPGEALTFFAARDLEIYEVKGLRNAGDAGERDVRIRSGLPEHVMMGVLTHELGHVAGLHYRRVASGDMTPEEAEIEANAYTRSWGFGAELRTLLHWRDGRRPVVYNGVFYNG